MKSIVILISVCVASRAQLNVGFDERGTFSFSNPFFNTSFSPPQFSFGLRRPNIPQISNPITRLFSHSKPADSIISNSINSVNKQVNSVVNTAVNRGLNTARSFADKASDVRSSIARTNGLGNLWNIFQSAVNKLSSGGQSSISSTLLNEMGNLLPNISRGIEQFVNYAKTASNPNLWKNVPAAIANNIHSRAQRISRGISDITSAMNEIARNLPQIVNNVRLNTTTRNQPFFFPGRTGIVHLFEWKFEDIALECEQVLGPAGYGGVQVSPINEYLVSPSRTWWERYQPISYKINSRSGDEKQFSSMVKRCLRVGVRVYVDLVVNHMAAPGASVPLYGTAGSTCDPEAREFPAVPFNESHFHANCDITNYNNATNVRNCKLSSLVDLNQADIYVREKIVTFMNQLIDLGVAGFRMDASTHMWPKDLRSIYDRLKPLNVLFFYPPLARPFIYQEVIDLGNGAVSADEYIDMGVVTEFKWSFFIAEVFRGNSAASDLKFLTKEGSVNYLIPSSQALVFVDNHDIQRNEGVDSGDSILTYKSKPLYVQAVAFTLASDYGIPRVMSSYKFSDYDQGPPEDANLEIINSPGFSVDGQCNEEWVCEHRWPEIRRMVEFRKYVEGTTLDHVQASDDIFAFCRGIKGFIAFNNSKKAVTKTFHTCLPKGEYCDMITGEVANGRCTGSTVTVDENGDAIITMNPNSVIAITSASGFSL